MDGNADLVEGPPLWLLIWTHQLLDGFQRKFGQTFMFSRGSITLTLIIPWLFFSCFQLVENLITIRWIPMKLGNDINGPKENPNCTADRLTLPSSRSASTLYIQIFQHLQDWLAQISLQRGSVDFSLETHQTVQTFFGFFLFCFVFSISHSMHCHEKKNTCKLGKKKNTHWHHRARSIAAVISVSPPAVAPYALQLTISCNQPTAPTWICDCQLGYYGNHIWMFL